MLVAGLWSKEILKILIAMLALIVDWIKKTHKKSLYVTSVWPLLILFC